MAAKKRFAVQVGGLEFDLASFPDMPEEVRQYLDEVGRQLEENGAEGRSCLGDVMPQYVDDWIRASVIAIQKRVDEEGPDAVKAGEMDRDRYGGHMDKMVTKTLAQIDAETGGQHRPELEKTAALLCGSWRMLIKRDGDWRGLGSDLAVKLFQGVAIAALLRTVDMERTKEDGHEEA